MLSNKALENNDIKIINKKIKDVISLLASMCVLVTGSYLMGEMLIGAKKVSVLWMVLYSLSIVSLMGLLVIAFHIIKSDFLEVRREVSSTKYSNIFFVILWFPAIGFLGALSVSGNQLSEVITEYKSNEKQVKALFPPPAAWALQPPSNSLEKLDQVFSISALELPNLNSEEKVEKHISPYSYCVNGETDIALTKVAALTLLDAREGIMTDRVKIKYLQEYIEMQSKSRNKLEAD
ncbi:Rz1 family lipoprotein [Xenorhabdus ehlersii]|uniref:Lipoprotein Rz1 n=1 Tax=Xenorhabdus ehlersii TaxID=290111 RepID=A0A2D0IJP9_9GAMM|nr:Rz1 family lipoprotein [Xenorhabdus ehlersii]PHM21976.1 peptidase [Xenorhabdus ehlersii]RKE87850.1 lipoprotein Rz1 precursor [Xenorhabdus ehlersii]RKE90564.1 lipoprotein Rz1 precursor [Xenorhabdus ehlersii]RKE91795.1 lipoprotein Rz1 precursor [Xenorhabdus ehlersii]